MSDAPIVSVEDGRAIYRASSLGMCDRALIAARMGMTPAAPPQWLQAKFDEGHALEQSILNRVSDRTGYPVTAAQEPVEIAVDEFALIRGHIDGRTMGAGVEAKALGPDLTKEWLRGSGQFFATHPLYRDQLTVYMAGTGWLPFFYAVWDKANEELHLELIEEPPGDIDAIRDRLHQIDEQGRAGSLPVDCPNPSFPCPFYYLPGHESTAAQPDSTDTFAALAREAVEAREDKRRAEARAKEANARLLQHMQLLGEDKLAGSGYVANRVASKSTSFDRKAMEGDGVLDKYRNVTEYEYVKASREED